MTTLKSERVCDLCGYRVGTADRGSHKNGPICRNRRDQLDRGRLPLPEGLFSRVILKEAIKPQGGYPSIFYGPYGGDYYADAWMVRAVNFYSAAAMQFVVRKITAGQKTCEGEMAHAILAGLPGMDT